MLEALTPGDGAATAGLDAGEAVELLQSAFDQAHSHL